MFPVDVKHRTYPLLNRHPLAKITVAAKGIHPPLYFFRDLYPRCDSPDCILPHLKSENVFSSVHGVFTAAMVLYPTRGLGRTSRW